MAGVPARKTALGGISFSDCGDVVSPRVFRQGPARFSAGYFLCCLSPVALELHDGVDGLSLVMLLLAAIVTLAAVWFTRHGREI